MNVRGLLAAVVVLAALGVGVYFSNKSKQEAEKKGSPDSPKIVSIPEDQIQQIEIRRKDGKNSTLKKGDKWQMTAPEALGVDDDVVRGIVSAVGSITADRVVEENANDLSTFGLNEPNLEVSVGQKDGKTTKLLVGDETATGNGFFAKLAGSNKIYTIGSFNKTSLDKTPLDLRDKRLVTFDPDKLSRVELTAKNTTMEFGRNSQNEWQIVKPKPLRADNWGVEEIVRKIKDAKMDTTVSEEDAKKAQTAFASGTKIAVARMTDAAGTHELEVRKKDSDYFAKGSAVAGVFKVGTELGEGLDKSLEDFRNRKLFEFGFNDPTRIEAKVDGQRKLIEKKGENWNVGTQQMDSVSVQSLVDKLRDLSAVKFVETQAPAATVEIKLTAKEGKLVDHVLIGQSGNSWLATRAGEPSVYELDTNMVSAVKQAVADVKPPAPPAKDEKKAAEKKK